MGAGQNVRRVHFSYANGVPSFSQGLPRSGYPGDRRPIEQNNQSPDREGWAYEVKGIVGWRHENDQNGCDSRLVRARPLRRTPTAS
ncbi:MAG: hypothetical protein MI923_09680 [Phycisphaerales bacterium]|nr:hypothetical protein [Phycisphaerales bacterium]